MKSTLFKVALVIGGCLIGIIAAELVARIIKPVGGADLLFNAPDASPQGLYVLEEGVRVIPASNFTARVKSLDYSAQLRTNSLGLRGPEPETIDTKQWLALGDSFTMAVQVSETQTFAGALGAQNNVHIWNSGVDGYSTFQSALRAQSIQQALPIERLVLLFFTGNDFQDNERFWAMQKQPLPGPVGAPIPRAPVPALQGFLLRHFHLYAHYRIHQRQKQLASGQDHSLQNWKDELRIFTQDGHGRLQQLKQKTAEALKLLRKTAGDTPLIVGIAPPAFVIDTARMAPTFSLVGLDPQQAQLEAPQKVILELLTQLKIPHCDLSTALTQAQTKTAMYFEYDGHWTQAGHQVVADELQRCIEAQP